MPVLDPISHALAAVLAGAHSGLTALGADGTLAVVTGGAAASGVIGRGCVKQVHGRPSDHGSW